MKISFNTGNFALSIEGSVDQLVFDEVVNGKQSSAATIVESGLVYIVQRDGATAAYKQLSRYVNKKGEPTIPKGFVRESVPFTVDNATVMTEAVEDALRCYGMFTVTCAQYVSEKDDGFTKESLAYAKDYIKRGVAIANAIKMSEACGQEIDNATDEAQLAKLVASYLRFKVAKAKAEAKGDMQ